ncbi:hypothetical protein CBM2588_A40057 [Cupriavidus taiwanensis]|nr:hypothetical protein CBM2588_A40057 [Cupriavidus taiwanensis]
MRVGADARAGSRKDALAMFVKSANLCDCYLMIRAQIVGEERFPSMLTHLGGNTLITRVSH